MFLQKNEIVKIQSLLRASKARDDYKALGKRAPWERAWVPFLPSTDASLQPMDCRGCPKNPEQTPCLTDLSRQHRQEETATF